MDHKNLEPIYYFFLVNADTQNPPRKPKRSIDHSHDQNGSRRFHTYPKSSSNYLLENKIKI